MTLTYIPSYRKWYQGRSGTAGTLAGIETSSYYNRPLDQFITHELRLAGDAAAKLTWLLGSFYYDNRMHFFYNFDWAHSAGYIVRNEERKKTRDTGAFAEATFHFTDDWRLTGGVQISGTAPQRYNEETLTAFELGSKNRFLDDRLQLNADIFYYRYSGYQVTVIPAGNPNVSYFASVPVRMLGGELWGHYVTDLNLYYVNSGAISASAYKNFIWLGSQTVGDLSATWSSASDHFSVTAYVRNVGDNRYARTVTIQSTTPTSFTGTQYDPRTYAITLSAKF